MSIRQTIPKTPPVYDHANLVAQLRNMGLEQGDVVLTRVDFGKIGRVKKPADRVLVESLLEVIGKQGTLMAITHSPVQWIFRREKSYIYTPETAPCVTGRFSETIRQWPGAFRSSHPTCSMAAIGPLAHDLLGHHDHTSTCHEPIKHLMQANGKMMLIGCTVSSPGFSTVHYVYEKLALATHSLLNGLIGCYFRNATAIPWFRQRDIPGCSAGFHKFYPLYRARSLLTSGKIGDAESFVIKASDAYQAEFETIVKSPKFSLCDRPDCLSCRGTKLFNLLDLPPYLCRQVPKKLWSRLARTR